MNTQEKQFKRLQLKLALAALEIKYRAIADKSGCTVPQVGHVLNNRRTDNHNIIQACAVLISEKVLEAA